MTEALVKEGDICMSAVRLSVMMLLFFAGTFLSQVYHVCAAPGDPLQVISKSFPDIKIQSGEDGKPAIEFCPDNTCEFFQANQVMSLEGLKDFSYVYIYYFSDYVILEQWRKDEDSSATARHILSKPQYKKCSKNAEEEAARCVLQSLSRNNRIGLYFVRYDENARSITPVNLTEATAVSRPRGQ